jgi:hypothetical protein
MHRGSESTDGCLAALPVAAAVSILLARWLPIRFEFAPNDLGIVSLATLARYPAQQEMFWFAFALVAGTLLTWLFARAFRRAGATLGVIVGCEALGTTALLSVLWLPGPAAAGSRRAGGRARRSPATSKHFPIRPPAARWRRRPGSPPPSGSPC